ncbi:YEATS domain-containing protein 4-like isoform X1 [Portunus trituberculatus]|uniref:YEATS domain-containing protein 4-like isoform X1 n=2 Tax=Portunus trituberculatus TaxID=210409 RepID=UPI001E1CF52D|nr:YEATS domain-containing protein 4-like isoform X1 [Portunus trituberculatus]
MQTDPGMAQAQIQQQQQKGNQSADFGPDSGGRIKGLTIVKPLIYGNVARYFGKKREEDGHTHEWTVYVKPYNNEDMSNYVKQIHFKLHESYADQNRMLTAPPYEVTETGWGEFEIVIKIYFHDPNERPVTIYHILKLFQSPPGTTPAAVTGDFKKPLVSEFYEELIFQDPSAMMHQLLTNTRQLTLGEYKHDTDFEDKKEKTIKNLLNAKEKISNEIADLREKIKLAKDTITKFKDEISKYQGDMSVDVSGLS